MKKLIYCIKAQNCAGAHGGGQGRDGGMKGMTGKHVDCVSMLKKTECIITNHMRIYCEYVKPDPCIVSFLLPPEHAHQKEYNHYIAYTLYDLF